MTELIYTLIVTHMTIVCVTLFLHRGQAHKAITFHPLLSHFMRFWLWLTTGMITKQWVAIHRKHHRYTDIEGDPHSPVVFGFWKILTRGVMYYYREGKNTKTIVQYGKGTPSDKMERLYTKYPWLGITIMALIDVLIFGLPGVLIWAVQMLWIPFWAAGVINGLGHWWGYRNHETKDNSTNILPVGILIGGEELHNNHHNAPANAKLSDKWYEFDVGWFWFKIFNALGLAKLR